MRTRDWSRISPAQRWGLLRGGEGGRVPASVRCLSVAPTGVLSPSPWGLTVFPSPVLPRRAQTGDALHKLYVHFVSDFDTKLNPLQVLAPRPDLAACVTGWTACHWGEASRPGAP